jgi:transmembrane sensor
MQSHDIKQILERFKAGTCTDEELAIVERWYLDWKPERFSLSEEDLIADLQDIKNRLPKEKRFKPLNLRIVAAAIILITLGTALYFNNSRDISRLPNNKLVVQVDQKILPGGNKAILKLANGKTILLDSMSKGQILQESGIQISKTAEGTVIYKVINQNTSNQLSYNTISTPKGGQYQVLLPDGTKVWLNAASQLRFPVAFTGIDRKVELSGEAYFEVASNKQKPFKVITAHQEIEVLGTHFNVNAYADEELTKTTLLEGQVYVSKGREKTMLKPGQQAVNDAGVSGLTVKKVSDLSEAIAWKNGVFMFDNEDIYTIMNKIARWYDVDVQFTADMRGKTYGGNISRFKDVKEVLKTMELTRTIHFKIDGRRILVMP